jgi:tetratricopeptide (TPR) repeat protein
VKKAVFLILLLLVTSALLQAQWYVSYEKGREAVQKGQWQQAVNQLTEAIDEASNSKANKKMYGLQFIDYFPYLYRGVAYYKQGDLVNARADLEKAKNEGAIEKAQKDDRAPALLAEYLGYIQKPAQQIAQEKPPQKSPQNPSPGAPQADPKYAEGVRLLNQKEFRKALDQFRAVPENSPQHAQALKFIEKAQTELTKIETAQKKERISKTFAAGVELFKKNDLNRAEGLFKSVLEMDPSQQEAGRYLKLIEDRRQKPAAAVRPVEIPAAASREPVVRKGAPGPDTTGSALFQDAVTRFDEGKIIQAKARFRRLEAIAPSYPGLANYTGLISSVEESVHQGIVAFFEGEYKEAIAKLGDPSKSGNDNPHVYAFLACSYAAEYLLAGGENGDLKKEAVDAFGKVKGIDPRYELDKKLISPGIVALLTGE